VPMEKSKTIEYPGTSIQNQPGPAFGFLLTQWLSYSILFNNRVY
jgi:hypothetical protein